MANFKLYSANFLLFPTLIFIPALCFAHVLPGNGESFRKNGFQYIGNISGNPGAGVGLNSVRTNAVSLWLSPPNFKENQYAAMQKCDELHGELVFILTKPQYDGIARALLEFGGEPFWTSGMYDESQGVFVWPVNNSPVDAKFLRKELPCSQNTPSVGLVVQGVLSSYGLCSTRWDSRLRYICAV